MIASCITASQVFQPEPGGADAIARGDAHVRELDLVLRVGGEAALLASA